MQSIISPQFPLSSNLEEQIFLQKNKVITPTDTFKKILSCIPNKDLCNTNQVCKRWNEVTKENKSWTDWRLVTRFKNKIDSIIVEIIIYNLNYTCKDSLKPLDKDFDDSESPPVSRLISAY